MIKKLKISCDIDGCLADFETGYLRRFKKWPNNDWAITRNVTFILSKEPEFWLNLPVLNTLDFTPTCYCSSRVNKSEWTKQYLDEHGFPEAPLYQVPGYKISKANALRNKCDVHIEDSVKNFIDLNLKGIPCLLYNNKLNEYLGPMLKIYSFQEDEITDVYYLAKELRIFDNFNKYYGNFQ